MEQVFDSQSRPQPQQLVQRFFFLFMLLYLPCRLFSQTQESHLLPNGWSLTPAGHSFPLGDLPLNMAVSKSNHWMAVTNNGQSVQSIQLIDITQEKIVDNIIVAKAWYGLKFSDDEQYLYASGGNDNWIYKYAIEDNHLIIRDTIRLGAPMLDTISPAGLEIDGKNQILYVVTKENNSLYRINLITKNIEKQIALGAEAYACALSPDKKELYISLWGGNQLVVYSTQSKSILTTIPVGSNPNEILLSKNGKHLFVANGNDNSVSVIDLKKRKVLEVLNSALYPDAPTGTTSNGLALSADEKTLYIANADNNALAVLMFQRLGPASLKDSSR
jgi:YVTN family beta-propeller protein